jgi:BirA family biotin operon repressor/biotin-[acetyl-CoA-carboxylase] ligase
MFDIREFNRIAPKWARLLHHHEDLASTNDEARLLAEQGAVQGTVVLAEHQNAGRGRRGAVWASAPGDGLLFSVILRPDYARKYWSRLALAAGLGIVNALRKEWDIPAEIKWPNDVYIHGKKCAGILVESQDGFAVVGVGLNILSSPDGDDSVSLAELHGESLSREEVLAAVLEEILSESKLCAREFQGQMSRMRSFCWLTGKSVTFSSQKKQLSGVVTGLGDEGDLLVEIDGVVRPFQQAELIRVCS